MSTIKSVLKLERRILKDRRRMRRLKHLNKKEYTYNRIIRHTDLKKKYDEYYVDALASKIAQLELLGYEIEL